MNDTTKSARRLDAALLSKEVFSAFSELHRILLTVRHSFLTWAKSKHAIRLCAQTKLEFHSPRPNCSPLIRDKDYSSNAHPKVLSQVTRQARIVLLAKFS
jgi:hypothetical protein